MNIKQKIKDIVPEMTEWRHQIHEKPEIAYQEKVTSKFIANKLKDFGIEVIEEFGKTGVVGIIQGKENKGQEKSIAIRADMDALPMTEKTNLPYSSKNEGWTFYNVIRCCKIFVRNKRFLWKSLLCFSTRRRRW